MTFIFMDESWDLGFDKKGSSQYFVITFLFLKHQKTANLIIKKLFHRLKGKKIKIKSWVFHACKESPSHIKKALLLIREKECKVMSLIVNKEKVYTRFQNQKHLLYTWVVNVLVDSLITKNSIPKDEKINFIASRRETNKSLNDNFLAYLSNKHKDQPQLEFAIKTPYQEKGLQIADIVSYAVYQKYEHQDNGYYQLIEKLMIEEKFLFQ